MPQSSLIAAALLGAFVLWLLMNKRLAAYWALLTGGTGSSALAPINPDTPQTGNTFGGLIAPAHPGTGTAGTGQVVPNPFPQFSIPSPSDVFRSIFGGAAQPATPATPDASTATPQGAN